VRQPGGEPPELQRQRLVEPELSAQRGAVDRVACSPSIPTVGSPTSRTSTNAAAATSARTARLWIRRATAKPTG
jgi:hypothetical protein